MKPPGARSHPPSLLRLAERLIRDERLFAAGDTVLCACSGGPDSTALLHVLALLRPRIGHQLTALGVDHGLRPEASAELALAEKLAATLGVPFCITRVTVEPGGNLQARARAARLRALRDGAIAANARAIATGHTADDRAETFLLRLLRGSGPRGLAVLPPLAPFPVPAEADANLALIRPLLRARRSDVLLHLQRHNLTFAQDPSNVDPRFSRVRVRRELIPLLEEMSPQIVQHLSFLADALATDPAASEARKGEGDGAIESLGREQRKAIERARRLGRPSVRVRVSDGRDVEATFPDGKVVLIEGSTRLGQQRSRGRT